MWEVQYLKGESSRGEIGEIGEEVGEIGGERILNNMGEFPRPEGKHALRPKEPNKCSARWYHCEINTGDKEKILKASKDDWLLKAHC